MSQRRLKAEQSKAKSMQGDRVSCARVVSKRVEAKYDREAWCLVVQASARAPAH